MNEPSVSDPHIKKIYRSLDYQLHRASVLLTESCTALLQLEDDLVIEVKGAKNLVEIALRNLRNREKETLNET
jgi:hypothetical protein